MGRRAMAAGVFIENINDLIAYFKISDINIAISDTIEDSDRLQRII